MQKLLVCFLLVLGVCGCLSTTPLETSEWLVEAPVASAVSEKAKFGSVRLANVTVRSPFDTRSIPVLRSDGSVAFDAYNRFAATPSQLLRGPAIDIISYSGLFQSVVGPSSTVPSPLNFELIVTRLALDCRGDCARSAIVRITMRVIDRSKGLIGQAKGEGSAEAASGDYGAAFSSAFANAFTSALQQL